MSNSYALQQEKDHISRWKRFHSAPAQYEITDIPLLNEAFDTLTSRDEREFWRNFITWAVGALLFLVFVLLISQVFGVIFTYTEFNESVLGPPMTVFSVVILAILNFVLLIDRPSNVGRARLLEALKISDNFIVQNICSLGMITFGVGDEGLVIEGITNKVIIQWSAVLDIYYGNRQRDYAEQAFIILKGSVAASNQVVREYVYIPRARFFGSGSGKDNSSWNDFFSFAEGKVRPSPSHSFQARPR